MVTVLFVFFSFFVCFLDGTSEGWLICSYNLPFLVVMAPVQSRTTLHKSGKKDANPHQVFQQDVKLLIDFVNKLFIMWYNTASFANYLHKITHFFIIPRKNIKYCDVPCKSVKIRRISNISDLGWWTVKFTISLVKFVTSYIARYRIQ